MSLYTKQVNNGWEMLPILKDGERMMADDAVKELNSQQWISIKDELPNPEFDWVLCYADGAMATMKYSKKESFHGFTENHMHLLDVTHWMPLPEPPK